MTPVSAPAPAAAPQTAGALAASAASTDGQMVPRPFRVVRTRRDTRDTFTLELAPLHGPPLRFAAGQFTMLGALGVGEVPISISGDPTSPGPLEHTIRNVGGVTAALVAAEPGTVLGVRGPYGTGWGIADGMGGDVVLVAGGIGLAPLRPALIELVAQRARYHRVVLLYGARTPDDVLFGNELRRWGSLHDIVVQVTVDNAPHDYTGRVGLVTQLVTRAGFDPQRTLALVCGPEVMMRAAAVALRGRGVAADRLRLSMERNMKCGVGLCGHCQLRDLFICVDGPVLDYARLAPHLTRWEL